MSREKSITRRRFVAGTLATGAAAAAPASAEAAGQPRRRPTLSASIRRADAVVVGAGFAGLTAARRILATGRSVIVVEARDRVGGRVWNHDLGGHASERGGTFVGPTQDRVLALMAELGIGKFPTYDTGNNVYVSDGARTEYSDTGVTGTAPPDPLILPELALVVANLDQMSTTVPVGAPWRASSAAQWDGQTLESWINANSVTPRFRAVVPLATRPVFGAEPRELSLLFVLFYVASSGNAQNPGTFQRNFDTRDGAQMWRVAGGSQSIALKMAAALGRRIVRSSPVRQIAQDGAGVTVTSDRVTVRARQAIVAIPPTLAGRIDYEPILPFERDQLTQRYGQGTLTKVAAVYDRPFWRAAGLNGTALSTGGPVSATFDDSHPDGSLGVVFGFVGGDNARAYNAMSPSSRRQAVLSQYANFFGSAALRPRDYFETSWSGERWTRGCPVGIPAPGTLLAYGSRIPDPGAGRAHPLGRHRDLRLLERLHGWRGALGRARGGRAARRAVGSPLPNREGETP